MESSENGQESKRKRSPWIIILLILLLFFVICCCLIGGGLCWGSSQLPELMDWIYDNAEDLGLDEDELDQLFQDFDMDDFDDPESEFFEDLELDIFEEEPEPIGGLSTCQNLSGALEMGILVGPADVVGLEPVVVGEIPFLVDGNGDVSGSGGLFYQDVLEEEWGTYTVYFDGDVSLAGICQDESDGSVLDVTVELSGDQLVEVDFGGTVDEYPWSGSNELDLNLPVQDGAREQGEGWVFVLRLD